MLSSGLITAWLWLEKKDNKKGRLECAFSPFHILAGLLIGAWVCITVCLSKLDITVKAGCFVVQPLAPISPPTSPQAFEQKPSGTLKSGVESVWHGKGGLKVLLFEPFQSPTESTGGTMMGRLGLWAEWLCGNEDLNVFSAPSYSCLLPARELKLP